MCSLSVGFRPWLARQARGQSLSDREFSPCRHRLDDLAAISGKNDPDLATEPEPLRLSSRTRGSLYQAAMENCGSAVISVIRFCTWPSDQPRHATYASTYPVETRSPPFLQGRSSPTPPLYLPAPGKQGSPRSTSGPGQVRGPWHSGALIGRQGDGARTWQAVGQRPPAASCGVGLR